MVVLLVMLALRRAVLPSEVTVLRFIVMTVMTAVIPNVVLGLVYHRCEEYAYFKSIAKERIIAPIREKLR